MRRGGNPTRRQAHEPLHEFWRRPWPCSVYQECRGRSIAAGDLFPFGYCLGVSSPAAKMSSIRDHSVSDSLLLVCEPAGPLRARSMT